MATKQQLDCEITHEGTLQINNLEIPCFVLKNGTRVLSGRGLQEALRIRDRFEGEKRGGYILPIFFKSKALKPFIDNKLEVAKFEPIICYRGNQVVHGYEGTFLADLCDTILEARKAGAKFTDRQQIVADQAEIIIRSLAKVGIIALIDEATGYQEDRDKTALRDFLEKFLLEEKGKWIKTFPDEFFESIFKMKGWDWKSAIKGQKPGVVGRYINNYVWARIAPGILQELNRINSKDERGKRKGNNPQFIDVDFGHPKLKEHLKVLTMFAKACGYNWTNWERMVNRALPKFEPDGSRIQEIDKCLFKKN